MNLTLRIAVDKAHHFGAVTTEDRYLLRFREPGSSRAMAHLAWEVTIKSRCLPRLTRTPAEATPKFVPVGGIQILQNHEQSPPR